MSFFEAESSLAASNNMEATIGVSQSSNKRLPLQRLSVNQQSSLGAPHSQHKALPQSYKPPMPTTFVMETRNDVEDREEPPRPVFRRRQVWLDEDDELNDIWSLKRANPVIDEDDEEPNVYESPSKRPRVLQLQPSCSDDEEPPLFDIAQLWQRP